MKNSWVRDDNCKNSRIETSNCDFEDHQLTSIGACWMFSLRHISNCGHHSSIELHNFLKGNINGKLVEIRFQVIDNSTEFILFLALPVLHRIFQDSKCAQSNLIIYMVTFYIICRITTRTVDTIPLLVQFYSNAIFIFKWTQQERTMFCRYSNCGVLLHKL